MIAKLTAKELRTFFYSPAAWLVLVTFSVHAAICMVDAFYYSPPEGWLSLALLFRFPLGGAGFFDILPEYLFLYTALLTMGLMSSEYSEGGIKLLLSSPVRITSIVLGKYTAVLIYGLALCALIGLIGAMVGLCFVRPLDVSLLSAGLLTFYLVFALYTAVGLFISSLTSYPLIAAVGTVGVLFGLQNFTSNLASDSMPLFLQRMLTAWLSPRTHSLTGYAGLVNSADLLYFLILILLMLGLTVLRLQSLRNAQAPWMLGLKQAAAVSVACACGTLSYYQIGFHYFDFTAKHWWTPGPQQQEALKALEQPLHVAKYYNVLEDPGNSKPVKAFEEGVVLREASRHHFNLQYRPYYHATERLVPELQDNPDQALKDMGQMTDRTIAELFKYSTDKSSKSLRELALDAGSRFGWLDSSRFMDPPGIEKLTASFGYDPEGGFLLLESGARRAVLPMMPIMGAFWGRSGFEQVFTATLKRMASAPPKVGFLSGHGERDPFGKAERDWNRIVRNMRESLMIQGFDVVKLAPEATGIPADVSILVIADPRQALSPADLDKVRRFRDHGGGMFILGEPERPQFVNDIVRELGVELVPGATALTEGPKEKYARIVAQAVKPTDGAPQGLLRRRVIENDTVSVESPMPDLLDKDGQGLRIAMPTRSAVRWKAGDAYAIQPLVEQAPESPAAGQAVMIALQGRNANAVGGQQRIVIAGDADFMSNAAEGIGYGNAIKAKGVGRNPDFIMSLFKWLSHEALPVDLDREYYAEKRLIEGRPPVGAPQEAWGPWKSKMSALQRSMIGGLAVPLLIAGIVVVTRRRRR